MTDNPSTLESAEQKKDGGECNAVRGGHLCRQDEGHDGDHTCGLACCPGRWSTE